MGVYDKYLSGTHDPTNLIDCAMYNREFRKKHPEYFDPDGLLVFCGPQGAGKTLSAVQYVRKLVERYPQAILCTNVEIYGLPENTNIVEYDGIDSITRLENGYAGVIYLIDEIHLEFNSLESKNVPIEVMIEVSQQRKQRKHIVGTSQVYMRMAKPLREQMKNVVLCGSWFHRIQINKLIDAQKAYEKDGKLVCEGSRTFVWFHTPDLYKSYDTYKKMRRYRSEWQGVKRSDIYERSN